MTECFVKSKIICIVNINIFDECLMYEYSLSPVSNSIDIIWLVGRILAMKHSMNSMITIVTLGVPYTPSLYYERTLSGPQVA